MVGTQQGKLLYRHAWLLEALGSRKNGLCLLSHPTRKLDQIATWLYGLKLLNVSHHHTNFGGHGQSDIGDINDFNCHVISQYHLTKQSCNFMEWNPSRQVTILQSLVVIATPSVVTMILVCHVISKDHMIKGSCYFIGEAPHINSPPCQI